MEKYITIEEKQTIISQLYIKQIITQKKNKKIHMIQWIKVVKNQLLNVIMVYL